MIEGKFRKPIKEKDSVWPGAFHVAFKVEDYLFLSQCKLCADRSGRSVYLALKAEEWGQENARRQRDDTAIPLPPFPCQKFCLVAKEESF